jgi:hypothetical protein
MQFLDVVFQTARQVSLHGLVNIGYIRNYRVDVGLLHAFIRTSTHAARQQDLAIGNGRRIEDGISTDAPPMLLFDIRSQRGQGGFPGPQAQPEERRHQNGRGKAPGAGGPDDEGFEKG